MAVAQTKDPQIIKGQWIFSWYIRYQPMKHSYDKIICFQYFLFDQELSLTYRFLTKKVLKVAYYSFSETQ